MKISPSILDANFQCLQAELNSIATADKIHLDIMDNRYVPNMSFGASILKNLKFPVPTEVHLMTEAPENHFKSFETLGVQGITFHIENTGREKAISLLSDIKSRNIKAGITVDGYTHTDFLSDKILDTCDQILLMSIKAGFGGQTFMPAVLEKIKNLRNRGFKGEIEVDGGVNLENVVDLKKAGANTVVVGSFLMKKPAEERPELIKKFQEI